MKVRGCTYIVEVVPGILDLLERAIPPHSKPPAGMRQCVEVCNVAEIEGHQRYSRHNRAMSKVHVLSPVKSRKYAGLPVRIPLM